MPLTFYRTFIRSCTNWQTFAKGRKTTVSTGQTYQQVVDACKAYNDVRDARQIRKGTMMEFERQ